MNRSGEGFAAPGDPWDLHAIPILFYAPCSNLPDQVLQPRGIEFRKVGLPIHSPPQLGDFPGFPFNLARVANCANLLIKNAKEIFSHQRQNKPKRFSI